MNQVETLFCIFLIWLTKRPLRNAKKKKEKLCQLSVDGANHLSHDQ